MITMSLKRGLVFAWAFFLVPLLSCGEQQVREIGERISGPFDMVYVKKWGDYLLLNSSYDARFGDGSLLRMSFTSDKPARKEAVSLARLGSKVALNANESVVAIGFFGEKARLELYTLGDDSILVPAVFSTDVDGGESITGLDWFSVSSAGQSKEILSVSLGSRISNTGLIGPTRVRLYEFSENVLKPWITIPDDLSAARNDVYQIHSGAPVFLAEQNLLVLFPPRSASGFLEAQPSAYEVLKSGAWIGERDLRSVSAMAIDLDLLIAGQSLDRSTAFFPIVVNRFSLGAPDLALPGDDVQNSELEFKTWFVTALKAKSSDCTTVVGEKPSDFVLVADDSGHVFGVSGFDKLKQDFQEKASQSDLLADHFFPNSVQVSLYSRGSGSVGLPENGNFRVTKMASVNINGGGECVPVVVRADRKSFAGSQLNAGREDVFMSHVAGRSVENPVLAKAPIRGAVGFAASGSDLLFYSFSRNALFSVQAGLDSFSVGSVFEEPKE